MSAGKQAAPGLARRVTGTAKPGLAYQASGHCIADKGGRIVGIGFFQQILPVRFYGAFACK